MSKPIRPKVLPTESSILPPSLPEPACPRCESTNLRRDTQRIGVKSNPRGYATGGWYFCLECSCAFDGVTDNEDGILPWWVQKRPAGVVARGNELEVFPQPSLATMEAIE